MQSFDEFLNEKVAIWDGMEFQISLNFKNGMSIQFIPNGKTLDSESTDILADRISERMTHAMPILAQSLKYNPNAKGAGIVFELDKFGYAESITRALKANNRKSR